MSDLISVGDKARRLGVTVCTLRRWEKSGYEVDPDEPAAGNLTICYARVSSADQRDDLARQADRLAAHAAARGWTDVEIISDLGSGMNYQKRGLLRLLKLILHGKLQRLVLENRDRLLRFGADLVLWLCRQRGVEVIIIEADAQQGFEQGLARDVLEIITVFSSRLYGRCAHQRRQVLCT